MAITIQDKTQTYPQDYPTERLLDPPLTKWQRGAAPPLPPTGRPASSSFDPSNVDFSVFGNGDAAGTPQGPSGPMPSTPVQGNAFFNFLSSLFGRSGGSAPQGMTGLLSRGQNAANTDNLGNPLGRF